MRIKNIFPSTFSSKKILDKIKPSKDKMKGSLYEEIFNNKEISSLISPHITPSSDKWKDLWKNISKLNSMNEEDLQRICFADNNEKGNIAIQHFDWEYIKKHTNLSNHFLKTWDDIISQSEQKQKEEKEKEREILSNDDISLEGTEKELSLADRLKNIKDEETTELNKVETFEDANSIIEEYGMQQACEEFDMPKAYLLNNKEKIILTEKVIETIWGAFPLKHFLVSNFKIKLHLKDNPTLKKHYDDMELLMSIMSDNIHYSYNEIKNNKNSFKLFIDDKLQDFTLLEVIKTMINIQEKAFTLISNHKLFYQGKKWEKIIDYCFSLDVFYDTYIHEHKIINKEFDNYIRSIYQSNPVELSTKEFLEKETKLKRLTELFEEKGYKIKDPKYSKWFSYEHLNFPLILLSMCIPQKLLSNDELIQVLSKSKDKFESIKYTDVKILKELFNNIPKENLLPILLGWNDLVGKISNTCQYFEDCKDKENFLINQKINTMPKLISYLKLFNMKTNFQDFSISNENVLWVRKILKSKKFNGLSVKSPDTAFRLVLWGDSFNVNISSETCYKVRDKDIVILGLFNNKNRLQHLIKLNRKGELVEILGSVRNDISPDKEFFHLIKKNVMFTMKPSLDRKNLSTYY